ncbi:hypothetical protein CLAIMM_04965 [Cladophialophora immunda]|nr:hypothetical protein CLAIMM_04965 [Cladophialophora immunda]
MGKERVVEIGKRQQNQRKRRNNKAKEEGRGCQQQTKGNTQKQGALGSPRLQIPAINHRGRHQRVHRQECDETPCLFLQPHQCSSSGSRSNNLGPVESDFCPSSCDFQTNISIHGIPPSIIHLSINRSHARHLPPPSVSFSSLVQHPRTLRCVEHIAPSCDLTHLFPRNPLSTPSTQLPESRRPQPRKPL